MNQEDIIRMAREACSPYQVLNTDPEFLTRFAAIVAAHEREKIPKDFVKACEVLVQEKIDAVLAEREACAKVCDEWNWSSKHGAHPSGQLAAVAAAIRARGEK